MNIKSVHLSAFVDFATIFIIYKSKQSTLENSLMATDMVSTMLFSYKEVILTE